MSSRLCDLILFLLLGGVFGDSDGVKSVSVTEGDSVTLNTGVTERHILWMFGPKKTPIAQIVNQNINMFSSDVIFGDRMKMDNHTGSLTITNIRPEHAGLYKLQIISDTGISDTIFNITVYAPLPIPVITHSFLNCNSPSSCSVLCSVVNVSHVTLSWLKGHSLLSSISVSDLSISLSLPLEVENQDENTYSCVINNIVTHQATHLNSAVCGTCSVPWTSSNFPFVLISVSTVILVICAVVFYLYNRNTSGREDEKSVSEYTQVVYRLHVRDLPQKLLECEQISKTCK